MSRVTKTLVYAGVILCLLAFGFGFLLERSHVVQGAASGSRAREMVSLTLFIVSLICLAILVSYDIAHLFGVRSELWFLRAKSPNEVVPELEHAKHLRLAGQPLEAINVIREYLQKNPQEVEVMSEIAEIYNHDLNNYLAAALEYEELLKHKLPGDQRAWAALHLAKLYGRLNQMEKSVELLQRIDAEHPNTVAARRARKALADLGNPQPGDGEEPEEPEAT